MLSGSAWKPLSSLVLIPLFSSTAKWLYAVQPTQVPNARWNVLQVAEENVSWVITWLTTCTLWRKDPCTWRTRKEKRTAGEFWIRLVPVLIFRRLCPLTIITSSFKLIYTWTWPGLEPLKDVWAGYSCKGCFTSSCPFFYKAISYLFSHSGSRIFKTITWIYLLLQK